MNNNEVVRKALEEASKKVQLPNAVTNSEDFKAKNKSQEQAKSLPVPTTPKVKPALSIQALPKAKEKEEPFRIRTEPVWPMDDEQKVQWRKQVAELAARREIKNQELPLSPERKAEIHRWAVEAAQRTFIPGHAVTRKEIPEEPKERVKKEKKPSGRQARLGQTKLIDELLRAGKNEKEVFEVVRTKIPEYPADKLPKLIKLRQYHVKQK